MSGKGVPVAREEFPADRLKPHVRHLCVFAERLIARVRYDEADDFGFVALCFLSKQLDHVRSVALLVEARQDRDACLIARSMLEGMALLLWAARDSAVRARMWRTFALVEDFRTLRRMEATGQPVDPADRGALLARVHAECAAHLKKAAIEAQRQKQPLPDDPFRPYWHGTTVKDILEEVGAGCATARLYEEPSQWTHWTPRGIGPTIQRSGDGFSIDPRSEQCAALALALAFQAIYQTLDLLADHLGIDTNGERCTIRDAFIATGGTSNSQSVG